MKKSLKILTVMLLVVMMITISTSVFAGNQLKPSDLNAKYEGNTVELQNTAGRIMGMIRNLAVIASVIILMVIGVKFMLGSTEEKAEYKKSLIPLIVGIVLVVGATSIATFLFSMMGA